MEVTISFKTKTTLLVECRRADGTPESYCIDLSEVEQQDQENVVGAFVIGLLKLRNLPLVGLDAAHGAVQQMSVAGLPEIDYLLHLSLANRAVGELDPALLDEAERRLLSAASRGHGKAIEHLKDWSIAKKGYQACIRLEEKNRRQK